MKKSLLITALLILSYSASAQTPPAPVLAEQAAPVTATTLKELLNSSAHPLTIKIKDMKPEEWRRFSLTGQSDSGGGMGNYMMLLFGAMGGGGGLDSLPNADAVYYTQGQMATVGAETYLITYRPLLKQPDMMALMMQTQRNGNAQPAPEQLIPEKLTLDSAVSLSLLNVKKIGGMSDIRPFDAALEVAEHEKADKALLTMMQANAAQNQPAEAAVKPPTVAPKVRAAFAADKTLKMEGNVISVEEGENSITLRGAVVSEKVKEYAGHLARKCLKDNGLGFTVDNELSAPPTPSHPPVKPAKSGARTGRKK